MLEKLNIGGYPREYDPVRHGTYDPARYYGKRESRRCTVSLTTTER